MTNMHPHTKQQLELFDRHLNILGLHSDKCNAHLHGRDCKAIQIKRFFLEALLSQAQMIRDEMVPKEWKNNDVCIGGKECAAVLGFNSFRNEMRFKLDDLINSFK